MTTSKARKRLRAGRGPTVPLSGVLLRLLPLLFVASLAVFGEEKGAAGGMPFKAGTGNVPDFRPHVFWAYGAVCLLLGLFTVWTLLQMKRVETKIDALEGRIRRAEGSRDRP